MQDILDYYQDRSFEFDANNQMAGVNSISVTDILLDKYGLKIGNQEQMLKDGIHVYQMAYCAILLNIQSLSTFSQERG